MPIDPLSTSASALSVIERLLRLLKLRRTPPDASAATGKRLPRGKHLDVQAIPVMASIDVLDSPPRVSVELRLVSFGRKPVRVTELVVERLGLGAIALDGIRLNHAVEVAAGSEVQVFCERALADTEAMHIAATYGSEAWQGALNYSGVARAGRRELALGPEQGQVVWIRVRRGAA